MNTKFFIRAPKATPCILMNFLKFVATDQPVEQMIDEGKMDLKKDYNLTEDLIMFFATIVALNTPLIFNERAMEILAQKESVPYEQFCKMFT